MANTELDRNWTEFDRNTQNTSPKEPAFNALDLLACSQQPLFLAQDSKPKPEPQDALNKETLGTQGGVWNVLKQVGNGAVDEYVSHPQDLLHAGLSGGVLGAYSTYRGVGVALTTMGTGALILDAFRHGSISGALNDLPDDVNKFAGELISGVKRTAHDAAIAYNPAAYSELEQRSANSDLRTLGASAAQVAAALIGMRFGFKTAAVLKRSFAQHF